ncbi:16S rRNA (guanine(527)-N(7))-methyltransferase RsmG [Cellulomonas fimi]|uniref:Ribosomal RNA small subunit methyltransferase G n=1 Tax=Cellulomonas fimi TaxID=1708 RepID=A0A7Y0LYA7_CELFI|nr:16S rRNA (guanine(527)-N(7))-methyltransferase RsmG [Cellulomonas fimi]NMR20426.1 16S rRNA (guanine(527)-N(7))-methyltransferase RsmG [Cellulomonas fimi]
MDDEQADAPHSARAEAEAPRTAPGPRADGNPIDATDPLSGDPRVSSYLGAAYEPVEHFRRLLVDQGVLRGLVGPRELSRLWERHLLNSAAVAQFLPTSGRLIDVGSGAGLPGVVLATMLPGVHVTLLEPMERRCEWLDEVVATLVLDNVTVRRARAEEVRGELEAEAITARAVAPMDRLARWTLPLLVRGGVLVALKGRQAQDEVANARKVLRKFGADTAEVHDARTIDGVDATTVVRVVRETVRG